MKLINMLNLIKRKANVLIIQEFVILRMYILLLLIMQKQYEKAIEYSKESLKLTDNKILNHSNNINIAKSLIISVYK